ncbi:MAG: NAD-binding protein [Halapricum sp.]
MALGTRRTAQYLGAVALVTIVFTLAYNTGLSVWEGRSQPLYQSLEVVFQTFTTTGYGEDAPWSTLPMNLLVIAMQLSGIALVLAAVDVFAVPWLQDALAPAPPSEITAVQDHVVICGFSPRTDAFISELDARDREYVLLESDDELAADLYESGYRVVHGDPESAGALNRVGVESATTVVADVADDSNASIALAAADLDPTIEVITLVEEAGLAQYHDVAGATTTLSPRQLLGGHLAREVVTPVETIAESGVEISPDVQLVELTVRSGSDLAGHTFSDTGLGERSGVDVVGAWFDGEFQSPVGPDARLTDGTRLLVAGADEQLSALAEATTATVRRLTGDEIVVAGYGDSGQAAVDALHGDTSVTVLDIEDDEGVDVVGDARDPAVLERADIDDATALIVTVGDDTAAIFTTLIARELNPSLRIVVRANEEADVQKLYRAGADFVRSLATVSGRMLVSTVLEDEDVLSYDTRVNVVQLPAGALAGRTIVDADVRAATGCTVLAIVRDGQAITDFDPAAETIRVDDELVIAGTDEAVSRFERQFGR